MSYIGRSADYGIFEKQILTPNSMSTSFTLMYSVGTANGLLVVYDQNILEPGVDYSISASGSQIIFNHAPTSGLSLYLIFLGTQYITPRSAGIETIKETFTATASQTVFTLSRPVAAAGILVYVNGVYKAEGVGRDYTVSGSTLTFASGISAGQKVDVYELSQEMSASAIVPLPVSLGGTSGTDQASAIAGLGLGTMATQNASNISITSGTVANSPVNPTDIANKSYVDTTLASVNYHQAVDYATVAALGAYTYSNGTSGQGATITGTTGATLIIDGITITSSNITNLTRILVKNETSGSAAYNGVYNVTAVNGYNGSNTWVLTRATDYDKQGSGVNEIDAGDFFYVLSGSLAGTSWIQQTKSPSIGNDLLSFVQYSALGTNTGTTNSISKFTSSSTLGSSNITDNGSTVSIGGSTASNIQASLTTFSGDTRFHLYAVNGSDTTNTTGSEVARFGVGYDSNVTASFNGLSFLRGGGASDGSLLFYTNGTECFRIDSSGRIGIKTGSTALAKALTLKGDGILIDSNSSTSGRLNISFGSGYTTVISAAQSGASTIGKLDITAGELTISTGTIGTGVASNSIFVNQTGNIGIKNLDPKTNLVIGAISSGADATNKGLLQIQSTGGGSVTGGGGLEFKSSSSSNGYGWHISAPDLTGSNVPLVFCSRSDSASWTERMRIDLSGNLLMGSTSGYIRPTSGSGDKGIIFPSDPGGGSGDVASIKYYAVTGESTNLAITVNNDADDNISLSASGNVIISAGGSERLRFSPSGPIGLSGANYGTSGQVLTSQGSSAAPVWSTINNIYFDTMYNAPLAVASGGLGRLGNTNYTNNTSTPWFVVVSIPLGSYSGHYIAGYVNNVEMAVQTDWADGNDWVSISFIVPPGSYYKIFPEYGQGWVTGHWYEYH